MSAQLLALPIRVLRGRVRHLLHRGRALSAVLILASLLWSQPGRADPFHYQTLPLGQRALGMGGAFTGLADDASAAYYNPAGLAQIVDSALSASLTINAFDRRTVSGGYRTRLGTASLKHESQPSLPVFVTLVKKVGRKDEEGVRRHAVAISTFTVDQRELTFDLELRSRGTAPDTADTFSANRSDSTIWNGLSYAYRISSRLAVGTSIFLSHSRMSYSDEHINARLGALDSTQGTYESQSGLWHSHRVRSNVHNFVMRFGVLYDTEKKLRIGLMFQPPSIFINGSADVRERLLTSDNTAMEGSGVFKNVSQGGLGARNPLPWEIRVGGSYQLRDWVTLAADASLYGRDGTPQNPIVGVGQRRPDPQTGAVAEAGVLLPESWHRVMTGNVSIGAEAVIEETIALRGGLFTSLSAAPDVPRVSSIYRPADVHWFGGTFSVGYVANGYDLSLGLAGLFGRGDALAYDVDATSSDRYFRTGVTDRQLFVFLSGAKSAVNRLATTAVKKVEEMREESEQREAREAREQEAREQQRVREQDAREPQIREQETREQEAR